MGIFDKIFKKKEKGNELNEKKVYQSYELVEQKPDNNTKMQSDFVEEDTLPAKIGMIITKELKVDNIEDILLLKEKYIAIDVETTGLDMYDDRIVEIGAVVFENGEIKDSFNSLINPKKLISYKASCVNHITNEMLKDAPEEQAIYPKFLGFLEKNMNEDLVVCAHNAKFDMGFISNTLTRLGYDLDIRYVDTLSLSRKNVKGVLNYKLETIAEQFGIKNEEAHRATYDAEVCGKVLWELLAIKEKEFESIRREIEITTPNDAEMEVCAVIQECILKNEGDISVIRLNKNSNNYVEMKCWDAFVKFKFVKKGKYVIVPKGSEIGLSLPIEQCSISEGGTSNVRIYFSNPDDLRILESVFYKMFDSAYKRMQTDIKNGEYFKHAIERYFNVLPLLSEDDMNIFLDRIKQNNYEELNVSIKASPTISRDNITINAIHSRCPLTDIKNEGDFEKVYLEAVPYWEKGEIERKNGNYEEAISLYDKSRYLGYRSPSLYESYSKAYHQLKDYDNEIAIIDEFLSRKTYGKEGMFEARRDKAIQMLCLKREAEEKAKEKEKMREQKRQEKAIKDSMPKKNIARPVVQIGVDKSIVKEYSSIAQATKETGINSKSIRNAANGIQKQAGGYIWKFKDN